MESLNTKRLKLAGGWWILLVYCLLPVCPGLGQEQPLVAWEGQTMGSTYVVQIAGTNLSPQQIQVLQGAVEHQLRELNRQVSHYIPNSELSRFNQSRSLAPFKVSPDFARLVRFALDLNRRSNGAFDPTLGPVINLWGFGEKDASQAVPDKAELAAARAQTGCRFLRVTDRDELVKEIPELGINLSAIAKGYGADAIARVVRSFGHTNVYAAIAGDVVAHGLNARGTKWQIGISVPKEHWREGDPMAGVAALSNQGLSTSGDYQKYFLGPQGRRLSHIIDPSTGHPVQHNLAGVSVVAPNGMTADALSTTLFVLGPKKRHGFHRAVDQRRRCLHHA